MKRKIFAAFLSLMMVISMLPILILYAFFQKQILRGMDTAEGLK